MKISKLRAFTIAGTVVGAASLATISGLTASVILRNQSSNNQNYSKTGNGNKSSTSWNSIFPNKKVINSKSGFKAGAVVNQINSISDLWNFYSKPTNIPSDYTITLDKVTTYLDESNQSLDLQVQLRVQDDKGSAPQLVDFLIYGFSNFSSSDYKQYFEKANSDGTLSKIIDPRDLSADPNSPNYFAKLYKPVIPEELTVNKINVSPQSFSVNGDKATFTYLLYSNNQQVQVNANVAVVSGIYTYPVFLTMKMFIQYESHLILIS